MIITFSSVPSASAGSTSNIGEFCTKRGHQMDMCLTCPAIEQRKYVNLCSIGTFAMVNKITVEGTNYFGTRYET